MASIARSIAAPTKQAARAFASSARALVVEAPAASRSQFVRYDYTDALRAEKSLLTEDEVAIQCVSRAALSLTRAGRRPGTTARRSSTLACRRRTAMRVRPTPSRPH